VTGNAPAHEVGVTRSDDRIRSEHALAKHENARGEDHGDDEQGR